MLTEFKFHHIGVAVKSIDATAAIYEGAGYRMSDIVFDPIQNVNICWLTKEGTPIVELLASVDDTSPVCKTLEKNGVTSYHCCYVVENIDEAVKKLRNEKCGFAYVTEDVDRKKSYVLDLKEEDLEIKDYYHINLK